MERSEIRGALAARPLPHSAALHAGYKWLPRDHAERRLVERAQHAVELVAAAHDQAGRRDHAIGALPARELGMFFDAVDGNFGGAAEHREHRAVLQEIDRVIAPLAGGNHAAIKVQDTIELAAVEGHAACGGERRMARGLAPVELARFDIAGTHAAPPSR